MHCCYKTLLGLLLCAGNLYAQPQQIRFEHLSSDQDLYSGIQDVLQDRQGFIWFATGVGLTRYDGYDFHSYSWDPDDPNSLGGGAHVLFEDRHGTLWIGTVRNEQSDAGLYRYDPARDAFFPFRHGEADASALSDGRVEDLLEDRQDRLWISTADGILHRLERATGRPGSSPRQALMRFTLDPEYLYSDPNFSTVLLHEDPQGRIWIGAWGLHRFDPESGIFHHYFPDPRYPYNPDHRSVRVNEVRAIRDDGTGGLWIGTNGGGLHRFDPETEAFTETYTRDPDDPSSLSHNTVQALYEDDAGGLWVGTLGGGLHYFDPATETFTAYRHRPGDPLSLANDFVSLIYEDRQGVLWVGTSGGGVSRFSRSKSLFPLYKHDPAHPMQSLSPGGMWGLYEDSRGSLWIATVRDGVNRFDRGTGRWTHFRHDPDDPTSLPDAMPFYFQEDRNGILWIGTRNGLVSFDRETEVFTSYAHIDPTTVVHLLLDREGMLWVDSDEGVFRFDPAKKTVLARYPHDPEDPTTMAGNGATALFEDHIGTIWLAANGVNRFNPETGTFTRYQHDPDDPNSLSSNWVYHIEERRREPGILWVSTFGGGLNRLDTATGQVIRFTEQNSDLPDNHVYACLADAQGRLWISTDKGLSRLTPETGTFKNFDVDDGLQSREFNVQSYHRSERGELFFGGGNGFNAFFPDRIKDDPHPPQIALTGLKLFGQSVPVGEDSPLEQPLSVTERLVLAHDQNDVTLDFVALHFAHPERNQTAYRLEPYDEGWRRGKQRTATYTNLDPGDYVFRMRAANADGVWTEEGTSLGLTILPPWWRTPWAYGLYGLLLIAGVFAVDRVQRRRLIRRERERALQRELEQARQIEAMNVKLRAHEQQLEDQNHRLLELDELKSRFFANISHEFRTPLTLILGPLKDLLEEAFGPVPENQQVQLLLMQRSGQRLLRLINQLLDLARLEVGHLTLRARKADLVPLVRATAQAFSSMAGRKQITLRVAVPQQEHLLYFEPDKIEKVLYNLLSNAFKYTPEQGAIIVRLEEEEGHVAITVEDTGKGIPSDMLPFIFNRFYQVDSSSTREQEGTGIGLALVKELVTLHGGTIRVESAVGVGTTFCIRLPKDRAHLSDQDIVETVDEEAVLETPDESSLFEIADDLLASGGDEPNRSPADAPVILIVEDNDDVRAYLRSHLAADYRIVEAVDGVEGLERAREWEPALVLSDVMMPRMDGYALCQAIKADAQLNHIPVVLLTARADEASKIAGLETGADDYLYKPFNAEALQVRVENLIEIRRRLRTRFSEEVRLGPSDIVVSSREALFLEKVRAVVEAELSNSQLTMEQVAEAVGLGLRQLHRRLKATVGLTPGGYVRMLRMKRAAQLLEQGAGNVSAVAYAVGFNDVTYFSRLFKQTHGVPPSQYGKD